MTSPEISRVKKDLVLSKTKMHDLTRGLDVKHAQSNTRQKTVRAASLQSSTPDIDLFDHCVMNLGQKQ